MNNSFETLKALEMELVTETTRTLPERINELLHEDFEEIGKSGRVFDKAMIVSEMPSWEHQQITLSDFKFTQLAPAVVMVKYQSETAGIAAHRTSIWVNDAGRWQMLHHQGTLSE